MRNEILATFFDHNRQRYENFDFSLANLHTQISIDLRNAFEELTGHYNSRSRHQAWRSTKDFMSFLSDVNVRTDDDRTNFLEQYAKSLNENSRLRKTNGTHYNFAAKIVRCVAEASVGTLWNIQEYPFMRFVREEVSLRDNDISAKELNKIVEVCKREIAEIQIAIDVRRQVEKGEAISHPDLDSCSILALRRLIRLEGQGVWTQLQMGEMHQGRLGASGLRRLSKFRELTMRTCLPIYLLMMVESAANPMALMEVNVECIEPHPTDDTMVYFSWNKPRAQKEQSLPFLKSGKFAVPALVDLIKALTNSIRPLAQPCDKELLFIVRTGEISRRVSVQSLHNQLKDFRNLHVLKYFTFSDIRKAVASLIRREYKSTKVVSEFLQHKSQRTTSLYLKDKASVQNSFERLSHFQGQMINLIASNTSTLADPYITVFGLTCASPLDGTIGESRRGKPCLEFTSCATCKNAIIIKDDPVYIARLLKTRQCLEKMEKDSHLSADLMLRYDAEFRTTLEIITKEIIPQVLPEVTDQALLLVDTIPDIPLVY
ncbi:hypothetical protein SAMN04490207_3871 [Pseudomonas gessardii]|uniref:Uncharacterized protein n=2 Tax=Pseudomonas psychrophila TaxID=122355 RepID=A0A8I1FZ86_9PSED|nr:hypothetical protein [Pseudomonas gessardii]MBJ2260060.1 hypothetical protein [Pseudomonas psychrophila]MRU51803.1 hypothetical protein [Pseudomonas gessardii]SDR19595.1 hypothetical protein SAMN04490207_3871 [Pseudomonas gessardii]